MGKRLLRRPSIGLQQPPLAFRGHSDSKVRGALHPKWARVDQVGAAERSNGHPRSHLVLEWREIDGPAVVAPENSGFGMNTIRNLIPYELGGTVDLSMAPEGVRCRMELPATWLSPKYA